MKRKPTRRDLLIVIGRLQGLIGLTKASYWDDRQTNRAETVITPLKEAEELCIEARSFDPPINETGPWSGKENGNVG
jgi:hypothetical protein